MSIKLSIDNKHNVGKGYYRIEYYEGVKDNNGKTIRKRWKESIKGIFKYLNPKNPQERDHNKKHKNIAESIFREKEMEYQYSSNNLQKTYKATRNFFHYWDEFVAKLDLTTKAVASYASARKKLIEFKGENILIGQIDYAYCRDYLNFLSSSLKSNGEQLSSASIDAYFKKLKFILKELVKEGIVRKNPCEDVKAPKAIHKLKEWLTTSEIKQLINTPYQIKSMRDAFLLSCFCGLRLGDIVKLKWKDLVKEDDKAFFNIKTSKTGKYLKLPLNQDAIKVIGERKGDRDSIIVGLKLGSNLNEHLSKWVRRAGITKDITPHCGRHTFATNFADQTKDGNTLQYLLNHSDSKTTKIYLHMAENKPYEQVNNMESLME
jgi:integrase